MILGEPLRVIGDGPVRTARLDERPGGTLALVPDDRPPGDLYAGPGWVDLHAHVYDGMTALGVPPDRVGLATGVHVVADAGSAGEATLRRPGQVRAPGRGDRGPRWVNIGSYGLVHLRETADPAPSTSTPRSPRSTPP